MRVETKTEGTFFDTCTFPQYVQIFIYLSSPLSYLHENTYTSIVCYCSQSHLECGQLNVKISSIYYHPILASHSICGQKDSSFISMSKEIKSFLQNLTKLREEAHWRYEMVLPCTSASCKKPTEQISRDLSLNLFCKAYSA